VKKHLLSFAQAKAFPITEYLARLGFAPASIRGNSYWYRSPLRTEKEASFKVDAKKNVWYDHGEGEGGTIIDLIVKHDGCTPYKALEKLSYAKPAHFSFQQPQPSAHVPEEKLELLSVRNLASDDLLNYLRGRGITAATAGQYCKEVEFRIKKRTYTAVGFANRSGGYDLRNSWFKGSSSPKDMSLITNNEQKLCAFEGFMDFLSALEIGTDEVKQLLQQSDFLVLNSVSLIKRSSELMRPYKEVNAFFDNDKAGDKAKEYLKAQSIPFWDASFFYQKYKDVNEYLIDNIRQANTIKRGQARR